MEQPPEDTASPADIIPPSAAGDADVTFDWRAPERPRLDRTDGLWVLGIAVAAIVLYLARLGSPGVVLPDDNPQCMKSPPLAGQPCYELIPLDEVHYVPDARDIIRYGTESDVRVTEDSNPFVVHPPVGKWFMAGGIKIFGDTPIGWRFFGALLGALTTAVAYVLARRLWRARWAAIMAGILLAVEGLWFVQSRIAMLDIYAAAFLFTGIWLLVEDRQRTADIGPGPRWWRVGAGAMFGLALATKWSVGPLLAVAVGIAFGHEVWRARTDLHRKVLPSILTFGGTLVLLPVTIYVSTFLPWALNDNRYHPGDCGDRSTIATQWICYHDQIVGFHRGLEKYKTEEPNEDAPEDAVPVVKPAHPYFGHAWTWPWIGRPVAHHFESVDERAAEVLGLPNPAIWWPAFFVAIPALVFWTIRRGDQVAPWLLSMILAGWLPYLLADLIDRPVFLFYAMPIVPFLVLGVVHTLVRMTHPSPNAPVIAGAYLVMAVAAFAYFYPVLTAHPIPRSGPFGWQAHMWLNGPLGDCDAVNAIKIRCWI